ncbi:MAG: endonuclease [Flavobacterium sp.]|nr:endonuclease [Flavobacterium sp.]
MIKKLLFVLLFSNISFSQVYINELDADTPSTDILEFVELKSVTPNFSLDGYVLVFFNAGNLDKAYMSFDLDGLVTDVNGIITLGNSGVSPAPDRIINDNIIQNGPDAVAIYLGNPSDFINGTTVAHQTNLIDALIHKTADANPVSLMAALGETFAYDEFISTMSPSDANSIQRKNDGTYETKAPTPDVPNDGSGTIANAILATFSAAELSEPNPFTITFSTQTLVTGSDLVLNYSLANGTFTTGDYTGPLTATIPVGTSSVIVNYTMVDDVINEGDEILKLTIAAVGPNYSLTNNNIEVRVHDNDYIVQPWGTPIDPTYGLCPRNIPVGYYDSLEGKSGAQLKQAIQDIIANPTVVREHTYADVWEMLKDADASPLNSSDVWLMYVEHPSSKLNQQTGTSGAIGAWNREHIYCQSRGAFNLDTGAPNDGIDVWDTTDANDITAGGADGHHIRAEDSPENSSRNNKNYGVDASGTDDYNGPTGNLGSWRGDVARAVFYMAVRYNGLNVVPGFPSETPTGYIGDLTTLLAWNVTDKSDDFEMNHNNVVYNWQKNRNPFVDYPVLADYVFGSLVGQTWNAALATQDFNKLNVVMYPNPSNGSIRIAGLLESATIEVQSITGQKLIEKSYENESRLDLDLASGVYLVKITEGNKSVIKKLIIR